MPDKFSSILGDRRGAKRPETLQWWRGDDEHPVLTPWLTICYELGHTTLAVLPEDGSWWVEAWVPRGEVRPPCESREVTDSERAWLLRRWPSELWDRIGCQDDEEVVYSGQLYA